MKPQDIVILFKILSKGNKEWFHHTLADELFISQSEVSESLKRSAYSGLIDASKKNVAILGLLDYVEFGIKYAFPQRPGPITRGVPTAHSAAPLNKLMVSNENYVWPYAKGTVRGQSIEPLYSSVTKAIELDTKLHEFLALVDAIRVGKTRERELAIDLLKKSVLDVER